MNLLMCTDEQFAPATATVLKSIGAFNNTQEATVFIFHQGLSAATQDKIHFSGKHLKQIVFIETSTERFATLGVPKLNGDYFAYLRLLAAERLPETLDKVIYLDSDILVLDDLSSVWSENIDDLYLLAVPDALSHQLIQHRNALIGELNRSEMNYKTAYFNSGVLVMNLVKWRTESLLDKVVTLIRLNPRLFKYWDQDLLNIVVGDQWGELPRRWNVQTADFFVQAASSFHPESKSQKALLCEPGIVHFTFLEQKPWFASCRNPYKEVFFHFLNQTPFAGWEGIESLTLLKRLTALKNGLKDRFNRRVWKSRDFKRNLRLKYLKG